MSIWHVEVVTRPGLGRCLVATSTILAGETIISEEPALQTSPEGDEQIDAPTAVLRAYCSASSDIQQTVIGSLATIEYESTCSTAVKAREDAEQIAESHLWAQGHDVNSLQLAIMAFRLNGHSFNGGRSAALFPLLSKAQHSCSPNALYQPTGIEGRYVALTTILSGDEVVMNYLGAEATMGHRMRRSLLQMQKLFLCRCERCRAPDWSTQVPCPSCHPRSGEDGMLPIDVIIDDDEDDDDDEIEGSNDGGDGPKPATGRVRYVVSTADGSETTSAEEGACWRCHSGCGGSFTSASCFPALEVTDGDGEVMMTGGGVALGRRLETRLSTLVCSTEAAIHAEQSRLGCGPAGGGCVPYQTILEAVSAAMHALGPRHWVTAKIANVQSEWLAGQMALPEAQRAEDMPPVADVLSALAENVDRVWGFCAHSRNPPFEFSAIHKVWKHPVEVSLCGVPPLEPPLDPPPGAYHHLKLPPGDPPGALPS